jgi:hypothetical protein
MSIARAELLMEALNHRDSVICLKLSRNADEIDVFYTGFYFACAAKSGQCCIRLPRRNQRLIMRPKRSSACAQICRLNARRKITHARI